jgi:hypothetical protein
MQSKESVVGLKKPAATVGLNQETREFGESS